MESKSSTNENGHQPRHELPAAAVTAPEPLELMARAPMLSSEHMFCDFLSSAGLHFVLAMALACIIAKPSKMAWRYSEEDPKLLFQSKVCICRNARALLPWSLVFLGRYAAL